MKNIKSWKRSIIIFCLFLIASLAFPTSVLAKAVNIEGTVGKGVIVNQNLILVGPKVQMDGVINGDLLAIGNEVNINGQVDGSLVIIGRTVSLNGPVSGSAYISALYLVLGPDTNITRDLSYIGGRIESQAGSTINRDLKAISLEATLSGTVGRDVHTLIGPLNLVQAIYNFMLNKGWIPESIKLNMPLFNRGLVFQGYPNMAFALLAIKNPAVVSSFAAKSATIDVQSLTNWAVPLLRNLATLLILGLLVLWLLPAQLSTAGEHARTKPWHALLNGLLVFILGWLAALLVFALIIVFALFLYWISLPTLGFFAGAMGLMGLGLILSIFWLSIAYFSKIIIAYLLSSLFFKRFLPKYAHIRILPFLVGVVVYALLASIPYLGWLVAIITTLIGLGALWMVASPRKIAEGPVKEEGQLAKVEPLLESVEEM